MIIKFNLKIKLNVISQLLDLSFRSATRLTRDVRTPVGVERRFPALMALLMFNGMVILYYSFIVVLLNIVGSIISGGETTQPTVAENSGRESIRVLDLDWFFAVFYLLKDAQAGLGSATKPCLALAILNLSASFLSFSL